MPLVAPIVLHCPRLTLSPLAPEDADALFAIQSDPTVMRYWNHAPWTKRAQACDAIDSAMAARQAGASLTLGVREKASGQMVGTCLLFAVDLGSMRAEVGYNLASHAQGKGYMQEALGGLVAHAIGPLGLRRLEAEIDPRNEPSAKVLRRLGFRQEGLLRERWVVAGEVSDSALYGLLAPEFVAPVPR